MSKTTTFMRHRYRPVSEFDEVTLASKREYWRTKKREQRARLSKAKKKVKLPNTGVCKPVRTDRNVSRLPHCEFSPTLLNNDGSYQTRTENQTKGMVISKKETESLTTEESNRGAPMVKLNGAPLTKGLAVPAACAKVQTNSITPRQTLNRSSGFNGKISSISQTSPASQLAPKCTKQSPRVKCCVTPKSLAFVECKFDKDQRNLARSGTNTNRIAGASVPVCSMVVCKTAEVAMTEEEKAAKRRENWRIKKREQRAKRAEKLKMDREKLQGFEKGQQETGKFSCAAPAHPLSAMNTMTLRGAKQRNPAMSVDSRQSAGKSLHYGVRVEREKLSSQRPYKSQPMVVKLPERQRLLAKNFSSVSVFNTNQFQDSRQNHMAISSGVSLQPLRSTQAIGQFKMPQQKYVRIQRRRGILQGNETAEERLAKQREYWRIKKREQRAKRSLVLKGRLKDRDAFNWRAKRYQFIMEQMRKTPTGFQKVPQLNKNIHSTSSPISSFIKEDGTVTVTISQTTAEKSPPALNCSLSAMKSSISSGSSMSHKLIRTRSRPVLHSIPNNTKLSANEQRTQRPTGQTLTAFDPVVVVGSKIASGVEDATILTNATTATQTGELSTENRTTFKTELKTLDSCSAVTPGLSSTSFEAPKQEPIYPSIAMICSLTEQSQTMNKETNNSNQETKSASTCPENSAEAESCSNSDSQSTTLLVVASMKKLLEESLSSVGDGNNASINKGEPLPCKTEDTPFLQEEKEIDTKPDLTAPQEFSADTYSSVVVKLSPSPCRSPLRTHDFSSDSTGLCRDSSLQIPCAATCFNKGPAGERRCEQPVAACVTPLHRSNLVHGGKISGPQQNFPSQARGGHQLNENSELQRKREYWRVMKRQQRARKAKELERGKEAWHSQRKCSTSQVIHPPVAQKRIHTDFHNPVHLPCVTSRPTRPVLSPTASSNQQPSNEAKVSEMSQVNKWQLHIQGNVPTSATRPGTVNSMPMNHVKLSDPRMQTRGSSMTKLKSNQNQSKMAANKELDTDDVVQRKRMLWRIKKQEQRARKAARERELNQSRRNWSNNITQEIQCMPLQRLDYIPEECQTTAVKDEAEVCYFPDDDDDDDDCSDEPLSESKWRNIYLMDFDPVNQLLVCMVCGEQQYTFSVEEVRAHIEETHPGTLSLEEGERQRILVAWDEQVAVRERFFTNQLWQNSNVLKEESTRHMAEVEVILGQDDKADRYK
ncbi:uncharacterized protein si:dkey-28a3.2 [Silurus meridionalis]|uniref:SPIN-DOC-like zinc-finger domain-containing protein n=1 Tax=Silurus meridionalis TaxID=175797 RepID=A0A8T0BGE2_SILME|nr:uncharacterized protein si:dkey-28a3.2 [Silurus meridionalis]KAF7706241.1 hypothetical protein HF521_019495 [Silurus meridionalis]